MKLIIIKAEPKPETLTPIVEGIKHLFEDAFVPLNTSGGKKTLISEKISTLDPEQCIKVKKPL